MKSKALLVAARLERDCQMNWPDHDNQMDAVEELRRLDQVEAAYNEWFEKTQWVQETAQPKELGMHRADVLRQRIEALTQELARLKANTR